MEEPEKENKKRKKGGRLRQNKNEIKKEIFILNKII
jgi:hypothetical protein